MHLCLKYKFEYNATFGTVMTSDKLRYHLTIDHEQ